MKPWTASEISHMDIAVMQMNYNLLLFQDYSPWNLLTLGRLPGYLSPSPQGVCDLISYNIDIAGVVATALPLIEARVSMDKELFSKKKAKNPKDRNKGLIQSLL